MTKCTYSHKLLVHPLKCHLVALLKKLDGKSYSLTVQSAADFLLSELNRIDSAGGGQ